MMMQEKIEMVRQQIWQAIRDYGKHCESTEILDDVSDEFVNRLAEDSVRAKHGLREMFRKSPAWNETLDALVINGTRTHDPNYNRVYSLASEILYDAILSSDGTRSKLIYEAIRFFTEPTADVEQRNEFISAITVLAPKAYAPGKKPSRVFKALCEALGVVDNTAGSDFQRLYAEFADELSSRKINFKLFVSLNPAHFVTMSNPKNDCRGGMLTSCHSFNSTEYDYNNGCSGYARDNCTMIAFTAADPSSPETLNNRKTTRQLFMYVPGNGLLLQSRMYNSSGGTNGAQAESKVYRDLIQREISECENAANLWKTHKYCDNNLGIAIGEGRGFGGYADWTYSGFAPMISVRNDHAEDFKNFNVGTYGLCIQCGCEIDTKLYCEDCKEDDDYHYCDDCECECDEDDLWTVYDEFGAERHVCADCRSDNYSYCDCCEEYYECGVEEVGDGDYVCRNCRDYYYRKCDECGEYFRRDDMSDAIDSDGNTIHICEDCRDRYFVKCDDCEQYVHEDYAEPAHKHGDEVTICPQCRDNGYTTCDGCGETYHDDDLHDCDSGDCLCDDCKKKNEKEENVA